MWVTDVKYSSKRALLLGVWVQLWAFVVTVINDRLSRVTFYDHLSNITCQRQTPCFEVISGNLHPPSESRGCVQITACFTLVLQNGKMWTCTVSSAVTQ